MKTQFIRQGNVIITLERDPETDEIINRVPREFSSKNQAKKESRRLQGSAPGQGLLRVEKVKKQKVKLTKKGSIA